MLTRYLLLSLTLLMFPACGPRLIQPHADDGARRAADGGVSPEADVLTTKEPPPPGDCVLATSVSGCCAHFVAATEQEVIDDPCLTAAGVPGSSSECNEHLDCDVECDWPRAPSRAISKRDGTCVFVDECEADADCVVAEDCGQCCCPDAIALSVATRDECIFAPGEERNDCWLPCPGVCPVWPTMWSDDGTSFGMVARCEAVSVPSGELKACVPRQPTWGYLLWQSPGGFAGWGPALEITASGSTRLWKEAFTRAPHDTADWDVVFRLSSQQVDALFSLLAEVSFDHLPHETGTARDCYPSLVYQRCKECAPLILDYSHPADLSPELDAVYAWLNANVAPQAPDITMPDHYCGY